MKVNKNPNIKVNVCYELKDERKCITLPKKEAYATKDWVEKNGGIVTWFNPVD